MKNHFCFGLFLVIVVVLALSGYIYFSYISQKENRYYYFTTIEDSGWNKNIAAGDTSILLIR